ncbi:MAG: ATP-binding protein [Deltaproteobacteria bacterium]|nr:ATP-binding protein [Deltaproteobacteria bacterium]
MEKRLLYEKIWQELAATKPMILLAGPRQVGKTTLSQFISQSFTNSLYFNWDIQEHRRDLIDNPTFFESLERKDASKPLIIFDEIHKYKEWKNYLKGIYDRFCKEYQFLVSGSGRLDIYQKGGDSLAGRYFLFHLWPFTIAERGGANRSMDEFMAQPLQMDMEGAGELKAQWKDLSVLSGFPEPFLSGRRQIYNRWTKAYGQQLIREDIRDLTGVKSILDMETLYMMLPSRVGNPLSVPSLARDLKVSYNSVQNWLSTLERFFLAFTIGPFTKKISRAITKERKIYLWDSPQIREPSARFENMVALELWRAVSNWNALGAGSFSLHFIKNRDQQEVDFLIAEGGEPFILVEVKLSDDRPSPVLRKFQSVLRIPAVQLIEESDGFRMIPNQGRKILVAPAYQWLSQLP